MRVPGAGANSVGWAVRFHVRHRTLLEGIFELPEILFEIHFRHAFQFQLPRLVVTNAPLHVRIPVPIH